MRSPAKTLVVVLACAGLFLGTAVVSLAGINREQQRFQGPTTTQTTPLGIQGPTSTAKGALSTVIAAVQAARHGAPLPSPLAPAMNQLKSLPAPYTLPAKCLGHDSSPVIASKICRLGDGSSKKVIVLMGDSHAYMWLPAVLEMAWHDHLAVVPLLRLGCTPANWPTGHGSGRCADWFRWAVGRVRRLHPNAVLLGGSIDQTRPGRRHRGRRRRRSRTGAARARPRRGHRRSRRRRLQSRRLPAQVERHDGHLRDDVARERAQGLQPCAAGSDAGSGSASSPPAASSPYQREYPAVIGHTIVWLDGNHMTYLYSAQVAGAFRAAYLHASARHLRH